MVNEGLGFEWCIYHLIALKNSKKFKNDSDAKKAATIYKTANANLRKSAANAIAVVEKAYGDVEMVEKKSGGGTEPKTDLIITAGGKKLKCSLKYGGSVQLSSGGIRNTVAFLTGVVKTLSKASKISTSQAKELLVFLSQMEEEYGQVGSVPKAQAEKILAEAEDYNAKLQSILGSRKQPTVSDKYHSVKLAIIEEAMTGKYTFANNKDLSADHILSEKEIRKIDKRFIEQVASKTSVRLALKGRGKKLVAGKEVRYNEVVVRFDTVWSHYHNT